MAKKKRSAIARLYSRRRRRRSSLAYVGPRGIARKGNSTVRKNSRAKKAGVQELKIRDIVNAKNEPYEYVVYLFTRTPNWRETKVAHDAVIEFCRSCLNGFKIHKTTLQSYPETTGVNYIKLESESDLMMFMLCHREHVRKIFRMVNEP
jgi:hypothetical protein